MKVRQGKTRFDCPKSKKKRSKIKSSRRVFLRTGAVLGGTEGTVVFSATRRRQRCVQKSKTSFFLETEYAGTAQATEWVNQSTMIMVLIV